MGKISAATHEFRHGNARGDEILGEDLFNKFLTEGLIEDESKEDLIEAINEGLRIEVANYILEHTEMHSIIILEHTEMHSMITDEYQIIQKYCSDIKEGKLWGGDLELRALSDLFKIKICVINLKRNEHDNCLWVSYYGEDDPLAKNERDNCLWVSYYGEDDPLATECVYIYYNGKDHFDPLYMINIENSNDIETISILNDQTVIDLLKKWIKEEFKCNCDIKLDLTIVACVNEVSKPTDGSSEIGRVSSSILMNTPTKRKESGFDNIAMSSNNDIQVPVEIANAYYASNKRAKVTQDATDQMSTFYKNNSETITTKEYIQVEDICGESDPTVIQQQIEDLPMSLNDEHQEEKVEGGKEPDNKLHDGVQDSDKVNYNSESSETKPIV